MATQRRTPGNSGGREARRRPKRGGNGRALPAFIALSIVGAGGYLLYQHTASSPRHTELPPAVLVTPPVARPIPEARQPAANPYISATPEASATRPASSPPIPQAPFGESEDVFETGAKTYVAHCAGCHGRPGTPATVPTQALALWDPHAPAVARMVVRPPGALFLQIADGVPAADGTPGMPGYRHILSETQIWDLALLLRNARQELPDPVMHLLRAGSGKH